MSDINRMPSFKTPRRQRFVFTGNIVKTNYPHGQVLEFFFFVTLLHYTYLSSLILCQVPFSQLKRDIFLAYGIGNCVEGQLH